METFVTIIGWLTIGCFCVGLAAILVMIAVWAIQSLMREHASAVSESARHDLGKLIKSSAHWFAESPDTGLLVRMLGERIINNGTFDTNQLRNEWRDARKKRDDRAAAETGDRQ